VHRPLTRFLILVSLVTLYVALRGPYWLIADQPEKADVILVLAGETNTRPTLGLQLLAQGYAPRFVLNASADTRIYQWGLRDLAEKYLQQTPQAAASAVCPIRGLSTRDEARDAMHCLETSKPASVLLVTSDYHTARALATFRHEFPQTNFSVAAAHDDLEFGTRWWQHRQWAKTFFGELTKFAWWQLVDRWR
jgi:hypothetical protein